MVAATPLSLDPATFLFCMAFFCYVMAAISLSTATTLGGNTLGLKEWATTMLVAGAAFSLFFLRGHAPDFLTVLVANTFIFFAPASAWAAYAKFFNIAAPRRLILALCYSGTVALCAIYFFHLPHRLIVFSVSVQVATLTALLIASIWPHVSWKTSSATWMSLAGLGALAIALCLRAWTVLFENAASVALLAKSPTQFGFFFAAALCILATSVGFILMAHEKQRTEILEASKRDGLTGLYTKTAFFDIAATLEEEEPYAVVMVDIDFFKGINDSFGHAAGDLAIGFCRIKHVDHSIEVDFCV
ncbi:MAG: diguanylate cyclase [Patescibacteria group bacterium]|nr:diguanylate cyclase [Patescibacteria group bacterium]